MNKIVWSIDSTNADISYFVNDTYNMAYITINNCTNTTYLHINADIYTDRGLVQNVYDSVLLDKLPVDQHQHQRLN